MTIVEVSEGRQREEFWLGIKHQDEFVLMLVLTLEHHLHAVFFPPAGSSDACVN